MDMPKLITICTTAAVAVIAVVWLTRKLTMKAWQDFLDSLSTSGGTIFILLLLFLGMFPLLFHVMYSTSADAQVVTIIISTFTGIFSALMIALKGNSSKQQMVDRNGAGEPPPPIVPVPPPPVVPSGRESPLTLTPAAPKPTTGIAVPQAKPGG